MKILVIVLLVLVSTTGLAFAQPIKNIQTNMLEKDTDDVTIQITWTFDENVVLYKIGCVSCQPNTEQSTNDNNMILHNVTPLPNGDIVLYLLSLNENNEIITGQQIIVPFY